MRSELLGAYISELSWETNQRIVTLGNAVQARLVTTKER